MKEGSIFIYRNKVIPSTVDLLEIIRTYMPVRTRTRTRTAEIDCGFYGFPFCKRVFVLTCEFPPLIIYLPIYDLYVIL